MSFEPFDAGKEELTQPAIGERIAVIRTSDRINFKRCRRRWAWNSHLKQNLGPKETVGALWYGSGMHFALEDYHGNNVYGHPAEALRAYYQATKATRHLQQLPGDVEDLMPLGIGMMHYYADYWLKQRDTLRTYIHDGVPQVEVNALCEINLSMFPRWLKRHYDRVLYSATFDRVVVDEEDRLWIVDYKSAKRITTTHFQTDPQVGAYCWLGNYIYGRPIEGLIYQQHRKELPDDPRILADGRISTAKAQKVTHPIYRAALVNLYGADFTRWPEENLDFLNWLATEETPTADHFIRRDRLSRNFHSHEAEGEKILMEIEDMLDPTLPLYPNPTRDCPYCPFYTPCINVDDGSDFKGELQISYQPRPKAFDQWRQHLPQPVHPPKVPGLSQPQQLEPPQQPQLQQS